MRTKRWRRVAATAGIVALLFMVFAPAFALRMVTEKEMKEIRGGSYCPCELPECDWWEEPNLSCKCHDPGHGCDCNGLGCNKCCMCELDPDHGPRTYVCATSESKGCNAGEGRCTCGTFCRYAPPACQRQKDHCKCWWGRGGSPHARECQNCNPEVIYCVLSTPCGGNVDLCDCNCNKNRTVCDCKDPSCTNEYAGTAWCSCGRTGCFKVCDGKFEYGGQTYMCGYEYWGHPEELDARFGCRGAGGFDCCKGCNHAGVYVCVCNGYGSCFCESEHAWGNCRCPGTIGRYKFVYRDCSTLNCHEHCTSRSDELCRPENSHFIFCDCSPNQPNCQPTPPPQQCRTCDGEPASFKCVDPGCPDEEHHRAYFRY